MFSRLSNRLLQISLFVTNGKRTGKLKNHYSASNHVLIQGSVTFIQVYRTTWCEKSLGWLAGNSYYFYGNFAAITQVNYFIDLLLHLIFYILLRILAVVLHSRFYVMRIGFGLVPVWKKKTTLPACWFVACIEVTFFTWIGSNWINTQGSLHTIERE